MCDNNLLTDEADQQFIAGPSQSLHEVVLDYAGEVTYTEVLGGTQRGGRKLASSDGFTYTLKREKPNCTHWICSVRNKTTRCPASVKQYGQKFIPGPRQHQHQHQADPPAKTKSRKRKRVSMNKMVNDLAMSQVQRLATAIVEEVLKKTREPPLLDDSRHIHNKKGKNFTSNSNLLTPVADQSIAEPSLDNVSFEPAPAVDRSFDVEGQDIQRPTPMADQSIVEPSLDDISSEPTPAVDRSFDVEGRDIQRPTPVADQSIVEPSLDGISSEPTPAVDQSFNVEGRDIQPPTPVADQSIVEPSLDDVVLDDGGEVTYTEVLGGTQRGGRKLVSSDGFMYTLKREKIDFAYWICSVRNKTTRCPASVKQYGKKFIVGARQHEHQADSAARKTVLMNKMVKDMAKSQVKRPASAIVEEVLKKVHKPEDSPPRVGNLARVANRARQKFRPKEPRDKQFELNESYIQGDKFLVKDIRTSDGERHIVLATETQLQILQIATRWFMDATSKVVKEPFIQLATIHAFVRKGKCSKQVPLAFVLMSRRTKADYLSVFKVLKKAMSGPPCVEWFMLNFEAAAWKAVREAFPNTVVKGCVFHFTQALYRKILSMGLGTVYSERADKYRFLRKVMALPFLPAEHIRLALNSLLDAAHESGHELLNQFMDYVQATWFQSSVWRPENWSVFQQIVRTNNDVEGWLHRMNSRFARGKPSVYVLIPLLLEEAKTVELQVQLVSEMALIRYQKTANKMTHARLFQLWEEYEDNEITISCLLQDVSCILGFAPVPEDDVAPQEDK